MLVKVVCICARMYVHAQRLIKLSVFSEFQTAMNSYNFKDKYTVKLEQRVQVSCHGDRRGSALLGRRNRKLREGNESFRGNRAYKDQMSDSEQSDASYSYSDKFESDSLSDRPFSSHPPPTPRKGARTQRVSKISVHPTGTAMCIHTHREYVSHLQYICVLIYIQCVCVHVEEYSQEYSLRM